MKFVPINNYPNYMISKEGVIKSIDRFENRTSKRGKHYTIFHKGQTLRQLKQTKGYKMVNLYNDFGWSFPLVHRLVAEHYHKDYKPEVMIRFKDGNPDNCKLSNLVITKFEHNRG